MNITTPASVWSLYQSMNGVIAHRGASGDAPENTAPAIELAQQQGANWVEVDVTISADGIAVIHHDDELQRCTNGQGLVTEHTWQQLQQLDSGTWFHPSFVGTRILTLHSLLLLAAKLQLSLNLEIKPMAGLEQATIDATAHAIHSAAQSLDALPALLISSFNVTALQLAAKHLAPWPRALNVEAIDTDWPQQLQQAQCTSLHFDAQQLIPEQLQSVTSADIACAAYTVNQPSQAQDLWQMGVCAVFSDFPGPLSGAWQAYQSGMSL
ncbi:glycerophosphoryl diester phosphodiesterase [Bacterioplanes sanyensis]|uniref:Glycerophosphoryl diester phosphodiesterase n=1 Tax=Bacterioplanes sanyensis TaxID=1249553 RepID=A0A222FMI6_9GAMM|nr:glycerophosphodiester phosphodiesterase family protein [Bacterioplanes sanyensis]ASP39734.1 glycerophosphoryl diester phosphodiesterase [Bacterioplanes sanyensis]